MARIEFTKGRLILLNWSEHDADRKKEEKKWKRKEKKHVSFVDEKSMKMSFH